MKYALFAIFLFSIISIASAIDVNNSYTFPCTGTTGQDLNTLYGWYFYTGGGDGNATVVSNECQIFVKNNGIGGAVVLDDDQNLLTLETNGRITLSFEWVGAALLGGTWDGTYIGLSKYNNAISTPAIYFNITNATGSFTFDINGASTGYSGTLVSGRVYSIVLNKTSATTYDYNVFENTTLLTSGNNRTIDFNQLAHFFVKSEAGSPGAGRVRVTIDDINIVQTTQDYNGLIVTIKKPINISSITQTLTPFSFSNSGTQFIYYQNLTSEKTYVLPSISLNYDIVNVDFNNDFFIYKYLIIADGTQKNVTIQPYLTPKDNGIQVNFLTLSSFTEKTLPYVQIYQYKTLSSSPVLVGSYITDGTGISVIPFVIANDYNLLFVYHSTLFQSAFTPSSTDILKKVYISSETLSILTKDQNWVTVTFLDTLKLRGTNTDFNLVVDTNAKGITRIDVNISHNKIGLLYRSNNIVDANNFPIQFNYAVNTSTLDYSIPVDLNVIIYKGTAAYVYSVKYNLTTSQYTILKYSKLAVTNFGKTLAGMIAVFLTILILGVFSIRGLSNPQPQLIIASLILGGFAFIGWINWDFLAICLLISWILSLKDYSWGG